MLSLQEISDRLEIQDLLFHYAELIDTRRFAQLRERVFTADAFIDYSAFGGSVGDLESTIAFLEGALQPEIFPNFQHLNANIQIVLDGERATGRVMCFNPMETALPGGGVQTMLLGLWYLDEYSCTDAGWRISRRVEQRSWVFNVPEVMAGTVES